MGVNVMGGQDKSLGDAVLEALPALLSTAGGEGKAAISDKLRDHDDHVPVRYQVKQLAGEATMPDSIIGSCQVDK